MALLVIAAALVTLCAGIENSMGMQEIRKSEQTLTKFINEPSCSKAGGICIEQELCLPSTLADNPAQNKFLCPKQRSRGAACCNGLPQTKMPCDIRGGMCRPSCGLVLKPDSFGICPDASNVCCPLV